MVAFDGAGRCVSVYDGVVIDAVDGVAVFADSSASREKDGYLLLQGCTVNGDVVFAAFDAFATEADFVNCAVNGKVTVPEGHGLALEGKIVIETLSLGENVLLGIGNLQEGSTIGIDALGVFTVKTEKAAEAVTFFTPVDPARKVTLQDGALSCD